MGRKKKLVEEIKDFVSGLNIKPEAHPEFLELEIEQTDGEKEMKKKFEYLEVCIDGNLGMSRHDGKPALETLGEQGWEAVASYPGKAVAGGEVIDCRLMLFKREK